MSEYPGRLLFGYCVSAGMISDQWRNFSERMQRECKNVLEFVGSEDFEAHEKVKKLVDFSWRVQRSADFMASLCQLLLPKEPPRTLEKTREGGDA